MIIPSTLASNIESLSQSRVLCLGDLMLDRFIYGHVDRTSPEAPVPIIQIEHETTMLGGVGNVARNLIGLGAKTTLLSVVGDDDIGKTLTHMIGEEHTVEPHLIVEPNRTSTVKTRFVAGGQQLLRADRETVSWISDQSKQKLLWIAKEIIEESDVIILSDYAKGILSDEVCRDLISYTRSKNKAIIVDPKGKNYQRYSGATIITPNRQELGQATNQPVQTDDQIVVAGKTLIKQLDIESILVTKSQDGMTLISSDDNIEHLPTQAHEVYDVSGAGDTVVATLGSAIAQNLNLIEASSLANFAASIVVSKLGTAVVFADDLLRAVRTNDLNVFESKILPISATCKLVESWKNNNNTIGFTNGCFDLLHPGHISLLRQSKEVCDKLIVALNSDSSVRKLKGNTRPIQTENARAQVLASLEFTDLVIIFNEETPIELIQMIKPDVLIKGDDYSLEEVVGADIVRALGGTIVLAKTEPGFSTSSTIDKLIP